MSKAKNNSSESTLKKIELVLESVSKGVSVIMACESASLERTTFYKWKRQSEENNDRYYNELEKCTQAIESVLFNKAKDGDTTAMIFWLTNRSKGRWLHKQVQEIKAEIIDHTKILEDLEKDDDQDGA